MKKLLSFNEFQEDYCNDVMGDVEVLFAMYANYLAENFSGT